MADVTVRKLDDRVKERLRTRAAAHGRSMESEIRAILTEAVSVPGDRPDLFDALIDRFGSIGGAELDLPKRSTPVSEGDQPTEKNLDLTTRQRQEAIKASSGRYGGTFSTDYLADLRRDWST